MTKAIRLETDVTLSYVEHGPPDEFAVVFLPGPTDSWVSYRPVIDRMPGSIHCIAVSQRGHGDSDRPEHGYCVEDFAADAVALLEALRIERAVLVGHSGSCLTVRRVAIDHPERIAGLVLEASPTTLKGDPGLSEYVESVVATLDEEISADFARSIVFDTSTADLDAELAEQLVAEIRKVPGRVWKEMFAALMTYDDLNDIARITAPALLIWGDADGIVGREMQQELQRRLPHATSAVYAGLGHTPRWEDPARFAADVADFAGRAGHRP